MNEEESVKVFDLIVKGKMLPATLDKLVPLSFIGSAAVKFYQAKVKLMDQLGMSEEQRKATLADGQDAGEMLLNIEARIGELAREAERTEPVHEGHHGGSHVAEGPLKHERLGLAHRRMKDAEAIHRNPAAVAAVIAEAKKNEDIPTKTAVLNKIKTDRAEEQLKAFRAKHAKEPSPVLAEYLEKSIEHLIQVNSVVKQFFDHPDQVDVKRMKELVRQTAILVEIITEKTGRTSWKQLT
jgi:hypothetical protein